MKDTICYYTPLRVVSHLSPKTPAAPAGAAGVAGDKCDTSDGRAIPATGGRYHQYNAPRTIGK